MQNNTNVPLRYRKQLLEPFPLDLEHIKDDKQNLKRTIEEQKVFIEKIIDNTQGKKLDEIKDMIVLGNRGTGKSSLLCGFVNKLEFTYISAMYISEHDLIGIYAHGRRDEFNAFKNSDILVVDEIGASQFPDWLKFEFINLLASRYDKKLPTFFASNLNIDEFKKYIGDRIVDRLRDNGVIRFVFKGDSLRGIKL